MNIEKYTERSRGFVQSAQSLAMREGHQQFSTLHLLKVLLDEADSLKKPVRLEVLTGSKAQRFYERAGFIKLREDEIEAKFERPLRNSGS